MSTTPTTAGLATRPAPTKERPRRPTPAIAEVLGVLAILSTYARHLAQTLEERACARSFATIARYFGTNAVDTITAHLLRGLMRAIALQRLLQARAARGRDLVTLLPHGWQTRVRPEPAPAAADEAAPAPDGPTPEQPPVSEAALRRAEARVARRLAAMQPLSLDNLPSMETIEAEVRRAQLGRTIVLICLDFGISPSICEGMFWNRIFDAVRLYGGRLTSLVFEIHDRERQFEKEDWKHPGLDLPEDTREGIRRVLGFFVGQPPVNPWAVVKAAANAVAAAVMPPQAPLAAEATGPP